MSVDSEILAGLYYLLQQNIYVTANHGVPKNKQKKPKFHQWPQPVTAAAMARKEQRRKAYNHLESVITFADPV